MKRSTAITSAAIILLLKLLKGFDCADNTTTNAATTLIIPPSKYVSSSIGPSDSPYGGLSPSELALLSSTDLVAPTPVDAIALLINALPTSPFLLSFLPPLTVVKVLDELARRPSLLNSIEPTNVVCLVDTLCASPTLLKVAPDCTVSGLITAIALSPKIVDALPPSTIVCLLSKISPTALCALSPAVRALLIRVVLSPKSLTTLTPADISTIVDVFVSAECSLAVLTTPADLVELLNTIALSPVLAKNISAPRAVDLLCLLSKTALLGDIPPNVVEALLAPFVASSHRLPVTILARLIAVLTRCPLALSSLNPAMVAKLLTAWSPADVLSVVPPAVLVQLLTDLSRSADVAVDAIVGLLYGIACTAPDLMSDVPPCVRLALVTRLTSSEVTDTLSVETGVKLIGVLCKIQCFLAELPTISINQTVTFMVSSEALLKATPTSDIVDLVHVVTSTACVLQEIPGLNIQRLLSLLGSRPSLRALDSVQFSKLLSSISRSPYLMSLLTGAQIANVLAMLTSVPGLLQETPISVYVDILTQLFTTPAVLSEIPLTLLLDLLNQIENQTSESAFCAIPPCVIAKFAEFLDANDASVFATLLPTDLTALAGFLTKVRCFSAQLSVKTLSALLRAIAASSFAVPLEVRLRLIVGLQFLSSSILGSLPPEPIGEICKSFGSFDVLAGLSTTSLAELITTISASPFLLSVLDQETVQNLLEFLSTSQSTLNALEPSAVANLAISISEVQQLLTSVPVGCFVRFLLAVRLVAPPSIPTSVAVQLLTTLKSADIVTDELTSTEAENFMDLLVEDRALLAGLPPTVLVNLLTALTNRFAGIPRVKIVQLLASAYSVSPFLLCAVPKAVLTSLLESIAARSAIGDLPSECLAAFVATLSKSPCLMDATPATALESLLSLLSSAPELTAVVLPPRALADFSTNLALTSSTLTSVNVSFIVSLLSAVGPESVGAIPAMALYALLAPLSDAKTVYELRPTVIASLLRVAATAPRVLDALAGTTLNTIVVKAASSPRLLQQLPPNLLLSFFVAVTSSRPALESLRPTTIAHLITSVAEAQPCVLSATPPATASALLGAFGSQQALASLPPPTLNGLIDVLIAFPNLFSALPLSVLDNLLRFLASTPAILGSILSCTLVKFLEMLSSMPPLLLALPPGTIVTFVDTLCTVSPKFLCSIPAPITTALIGGVAAGPALAALTPSAVASLVSALNSSPCLILTLPAPLLTTLIAHLAANTRLLSDTPRTALLTLIQNVQSPESIPRDASVPVKIGVPCTAIDRIGGVAAKSSSSPSSDDPKTVASEKNSDDSKIDPNLKLILPENAKDTPTVYTYPKNQ